jgi:serine phosphatase RsbU (regulator of sigma subunit)
LPGGRAVVVVGDVVGRGVPAALISAAVAGVCEAAPVLMGAALEPQALLDQIHTTVAEVGGGRERVACFAALLDPHAGQLRFASAGHRGGYLVRPGGDDEPAALSALCCRGAPLGDAAAAIGTGVVSLGAADLLVVVSDGVVDAPDEKGEPWGERRLQRALRVRVAGAGDRAADLLVSEASGRSERQPTDDLLALVLRPLT